MVALSKKALLVARQLSASSNWHLLKYEGIITRDWKPTVKIECYHDRSYALKWNEASLPTRDRAKFKKDFATAFDAAASGGIRGEDEIQWI